MQKDPADYALYLINRFEREIGLDLEVDWVTVDPYGLWDSAGFYVCDKTGESTVYIPKRRCKQTQEEFVYHELAHAICYHYEIPKYITNLIGEIEDYPNWYYRVRCWRFLYGERPEGMCSSYSRTDTEEEFAELVSFVMCNRRRKRWFLFGGEEIDLESDLLLSRKVQSIKRFLGLR